MKKHLSIITPVYNCATFIENCLLNVATQAFDGLEHIVIDGGSSDGTVEIVQSFAKRYQHVSWLSEKDNGQSDAMNKGLAKANSDIVGFLNADDFYEHNILASIPRLFEKIPEPSLLVGNCNVWGDDGRLEEVNKPRKMHITDLMLGWVVNPYPINASQYFYHKSLHDQIGLYDVEENYTLDIDFLSKAVQVANVIYVDRVWGNYRKIAGTKTVEDINRGECARRFYNVLEKHRKSLSAIDKLKVYLKRAIHMSYRKNGWKRFR